MSADAGAAEVPLEQRQIFAMGGGGFTMEPTNPLLDDFVLSLTAGQAEPRILFLPTASGDTTAQINAFQARFADRCCGHEHLSLFRLREARRPLEQTRPRAGHHLRRRRLDAQPARDLAGARPRPSCSIARLARAAPCSPVSAPVPCAGFKAASRAPAGPPEALAGLGLLEGSLTVHADGEPERLPVWLAAVRDGTLARRLVARRRRRTAVRRPAACSVIVSSRPGASAQRVDQVAGELVRNRLEPELLGDGAPPRARRRSTRTCRSCAASTACAAA